MEVLATMLAYVATTDVVCAAMFGKIGRFTKPLSTNFAHQGLFSSVCAHVHGLRDD